MTTGAGHLRLLTPRARASGGASSLTAERAKRTCAESPPKRTRGRAAGRTGRAPLTDDAQEGTDDIEDAIAAYHSTQRRIRLVANAHAFARLDEVIRLVASVYHLRINWLSEEEVAGGLVAGTGNISAAEDAQTIAARLASARQIPLVIGDPERQTLWLSRRPFTQSLRRAHTAPVPLERVCCSMTMAANDGEGTESTSSPTGQLMRRCGPVGRALVAQSDALLALAPRVANCPARLRASTRYVVAAPRGFATLYDHTPLTSWLSLSAEDAMDTLLAAGADAGLTNWTPMGQIGRLGSTRVQATLHVP